MRNKRLPSALLQPSLIAEIFCALIFAFAPATPRLRGKLDLSMTLYSYPITVERESKRYYGYSFFYLACLRITPQGIVLDVAP